MPSRRILANKRKGGKAEVIRVANYDYLRDRILKGCNPLNFLSRVTRGELFKEKYFDQKTGQVVEVEVTPTLDQRIKAAKLLADKILPNLKTVSIESGKDNYDDLRKLSYAKLMELMGSDVEDATFEEEIPDGGVGGEEWTKEIKASIREDERKERNARKSGQGTKESSTEDIGGVEEAEGGCPTGEDTPTPEEGLQQISVHSTESPTT